MYDQLMIVLIYRKKLMGKIVMLKDWWISIKIRVRLMMRDWRGWGRNRGFRRRIIRSIWVLLRRKLWSMFKNSRDLNIDKKIKVLKRWMSSNSANLKQTPQTNPSQPNQNKFSPYLYPYPNNKNPKK